MDKIEKRISGEKIELREAGDGKRPVITGYAAVFNKRSENFGSDNQPFYEVILPGAFKSVLGDDVRALVNHTGIPLARTKNNTLKLSEDNVGLRYEFEVPDTAAGNELVTAIRAGNIDQSSFAFTVDYKTGQKIVEENGVIVRMIKTIKRLFDVSPVTYPAYPATAVSVRELRECMEPPAPTPAPDESYKDSITKAKQKLQEMI